MRSARRRPPLSISLFPFLSILSCVIGTLTLLTAGMTAGNEGERMEVQKKVLEMRATRDAIRKELDLTQRRLQEATALATGFREAEAELARLRKETADHGVRLARRRELLARLAKTEARRRHLEEQLGKERATQARLRERLEGKKQELASVRRTFRIQPCGSGTGLVPSFALCTGSGLVLHPDRPKSGQLVVSPDGIAKSRELTEFLAEVKNRKRGTAIFLVQKGGVLVSDEAIAVATRMKVAKGLLAVPTARELDFSLLKPQETGR
jgi:hypothetical protein